MTIHYKRTVFDPDKLTAETVEDFAFDPGTTLEQAVKTIAAWNFSVLWHNVTNRKVPKVYYELAEAEKRGHK